MVLTFHQNICGGHESRGQLTTLRELRAALDLPQWNGEFGYDTYVNIAKQVDRYNPDPAISRVGCLAVETGVSNPPAARPRSEFTPTAAWCKVITWLTNTARPRPTAAEAEQGLRTTSRSSPTAPEDAMTLDALATTSPDRLARRDRDGSHRHLFGDTTLTKPKLSRTDPTINFSWGYGARRRVPGDRFTVRWTGFIQPRWSGTYQLTTTSDDAIRVWVDDTRSSTTGAAGRTRSRSHRAAAGPAHRIKVDYLEATSAPWRSSNGRAPGS